MQPIDHYEQNAPALTAQYESLTFEELHGSLIDQLPATGATILDVGAGSGRDSAWFAAHGYDVVAVEPSDAMRECAKALHPSPRTHWLKDSLPDLAEVRRLGLTFDFILLSAVWMHLAPPFRARTLRKLATLLSPSGRIAISLRLGVPDAQRSMHEVSLAELTALSQQFGLRLLHASDSDDCLGRAEVQWTTAVLGLPDDGLGALPLLRHLILMDSKASTYKVALLRVLARIADSASGMATQHDDHVAVPLGLVALFWMRTYKPLIENAMPQMPPSKLGTGPGFVTDSFNALRAISPFELRAGALFGGDSAKHLDKSLGEIAQIIRLMPARYLKWPASEVPIFDVRPLRRSSAPDSLRLDASYLWSFGEMRVPLQIWQALTRYNVWIEPVLLSEWIRLMEAYAGAQAANVRERAHALLAWADPMRDSRTALDAVRRMREAGKSIHCVWSGRRLTEEIDIDHCFPFSAWPCGDAWNLMPAWSSLNRQKSDRLVTQATLERASERIVDWWGDAFLGRGDDSDKRFYLEACQTLPVLATTPTPDDIIEAMQLHRIRLAKDQGLRPWEPQPGAAKTATFTTA